MILKDFNISDNNKLEQYNQLKKLDTDLSTSISEMNKDEIFHVLNTVIKYTPGRLHEFSFFPKSLNCLNNYRESDHFRLPLDHLQLIFFTSLAKNNINFSNSIVSNTLNDLITYSKQNPISLLELCIILNSAFRSKIPFNIDFIKYTINIFMSNLDKILNDQGILITFLKTFRQNRISDSDLLSSLITALFFNQVLPKYSLTTLSHILIWYSDCRYYDEQLLTYCTDLAFELIQKSPYGHKSYYYDENNIRAKDISTLLWAISSLGFKPKLLKSRQFCNTILFPQIHSRIKTEEYKNRIEDLIDTTLSLWIIDNKQCTDEYLLKIVFSESVRNILNKRIEIRFSSRWNLLYNCVRIESDFKWLADNLSVRKFIKGSIDEQLNQRTSLQKLKEILSKKFHVIVDFQIKHLNLLGLTVTKNSTNQEKKVFIELLDDFVLMSNQSIPIGFMLLKLRLLRKSNHSVITVSKNDFNKEFFEKLFQKIDELLK